MGEKKKIYMIGNAHLDPVWLWRYMEGYAEIKATFQSALDRIAQFGDFVFTSACAAYYEWVEENEPAMFEKIREAVKEGSWSIAGGMWIQPDCNIPSGESFSRHMLYSQRYFREKFGKIAATGYNVDSFGHNASLPQILKKSGIDSYVYMRPDGRGEKKYPFDSNLFKWRSPDGSEVLTYRILGAYCLRLGEGDFELYEKKAEEDGEDKMMFYGVGNHGGGPTVKMIETVKNKIKESQNFEYIFSGPDRYFADIAEKNYGLPVLSGDMQHHASGCYSANARVKAQNREAENRLLTAEKYNILANRLAGMPYSGAKLREAWKNVLFNHFHDIMGGCSIKEAYADAAEMHGESLAIGSKTINASIQKISWNIDTSKTVNYLSKDMDWGLWEQGGLGTPIVVFNPLSWKATVPVTINNNRVAKVEDSSGSAVLVQVIRASQTNGRDGSFCSVFCAEVPAFGYATYWAYLEGEKKEQKSSLDVGRLHISNDHIELCFDEKTGNMTSFKDKASGREYIGGYGAKTLVIDDEAQDTWSHGVFTFDKVIGEFSDPAFEVIENGAVKAALRITQKYNSSEIRQDYILYPHSKTPEIEVRVTNNEKLKIFKLAFQLNTKNPAKATYEIPYAAIEKNPNGEEEPAQNFACVDDGDIGLAVVNNGKYSYSVKDSEIRFIAARSCVYADHYGVHSGMRDGLYEYQDQGVSYFKYSLLGYAGGYKANAPTITRRGMELNAPIYNIAETYHKGSLPQSYSGISIDKDNIILTAAKNAEDGGAAILRFVEVSGQKTYANIDAAFLGQKFSANFGPYEIKSFKITENKCACVNLLEDEF